MIKHASTRKHSLALAGCLLLAGALAPAIHAAQNAQLREVQLKAHAQGARVTLDLSRSTSYTLFTLENPARVVIDLRDTQLKEGAELASGEGAVELIRTGVQPRHTLRVVLQLKSPLKPKGSWAQSSGGGGAPLVITLGNAPEGGATAVAQINEKGATKESQDARNEASAALPTLQAVRALHAPSDSDRPIVVAVDAGHGGQDPGALGKGGTREKDVTLAIARALAQRINREPGMRAVLTRDADRFLSLRERIKQARLAKADMFISVHADSVHNRAVSGSSVYVLSERGASNEAARWLAERENAADLMGGVSLTDKDNTLASVLLDLSQSANISASMTAAERVLRSLRSVGTVHRPQVQQAGFVVLKSPDIPSMLVETAYISNTADERKLKSRSHQSRLAEAIFGGVRTYFENHPPPGTRFAQARRATLAAGSP